MDVLAAIKDLGFPIAVAAYLLYERRRFYITIEDKLTELITLLKDRV